jgi:hypothetical protein
MGYRKSTQLRYQQLVCVFAPKGRRKIAQGGAGLPAKPWDAGRFPLTARQNAHGLRRITPESAEEVGGFYPRTEIRFGLTDSIFGRRTVRMPFFRSAVILSAATVSATVKAR